MSGANVRLGVAGAGRWGQNVIRTAAELGVLAAVCDGDVRALDSARANGGPASYHTEFDRMLREERLDAVVVATPAATHAELALEAMRRGVAVLVEKPFALRVEDAEAMVARARNEGVLLAAGHLLLYDPAVRAMLDSVAKRSIGVVRHVRTRRLGWGRLRSHEDVWWSFAPHDVSVVLAVMGERPTAAWRADGAFVRPHIADVAYGGFRFSLSRTAHVEVSWIEPRRFAQIAVVGSEGALLLDDARDGTRTLSFVPCGDRLNADGEPELWRSEARPLAFGDEPPLRCELREFCDAVRHGTHLPSNAGEALDVVRALAMAGHPVAMEATS